MIVSTLALALAALPVALGATHDVQVGPGGQLVYSPEYVAASAGDVINFIFNPKNHTVTQSSFNTPCVAIDGGEKTGFVPVASGTVTRQFTVPAGTAPLWFYCGQTGHCGQGMVFAINPPADPSPNSFSAFKALAKGGTPAASSTTPSATSASTTAPAPHWASATATVTYNGSVYTTTYTSYDGTPAPTPADHMIHVGENGILNYTPANISAFIGDTVTFMFHPKNHTVTQSSFLNPCQALQLTSGTPGFKSGFQPVAANATDFPTFQIKINDTAPIWGYCGQTGHCQQGMVFAINAVESGPNNFAAFLNLAKNSGSANSTTPSGTSATSTSTSTSKPSSAAVAFASGSGAGATFGGLALSVLVAWWL